MVTPVTASFCSKRLVSSSKTRLTSSLELLKTLPEVRSEMEKTACSDSSNRASTLRDWSKQLLMMSEHAPMRERCSDLSRTMVE